MSQKEIDGGNDSGNYKGETAKPAVYSLDAIIALQKALEDGIPEELAESYVQFNDGCLGSVARID